MVPSSSLRVGLQVAVEAVHLLSLLALLAPAAGARLAADADAVADLVLGHGRADLADEADDLMTDDLRVGDRAPIAADGVDVGVADPCIYAMSISTSRGPKVAALESRGNERFGGGRCRVRVDSGTFLLLSSFDGAIQKAPITMLDRSGTRVGGPRGPPQRAHAGHATRVCRGGVRGPPTWAVSRRRFDVMSHRDDVREFLISRRANITPARAGVQDFGGERRVPGLRREEVATLAGVSLDYYTRLERRNINGASESVLNAIARALQLDDVEREHLFQLAQYQPAVATGSRIDTPPSQVRSVQRVLDNMAVPAIVNKVQQDIVAANLLGRALYAPHFETAGQPNIARFIFLDPRAQQYYEDWPLARRMSAATLRLDAGRNPLNEDLTALIGELSTRSPHFRREWAEHDVHEHRTGQKVFRHRKWDHANGIRRVRDARQSQPVDRDLQR